MKKHYKDEHPARKMDFKNRLQRQYPAIVQDLDVKYILDELYQKSVLSTSEFSHIFTVTNREEQARYLLDNLIQSGTISAYEAFVDSLAKDYRWLYDKLLENPEPIMDDSFEDSLSKGDVPRLPNHHVRRTGIERIVAEKLYQLKRHKILVLFGMSGSGKTCVVISTLRDNPELITNVFNGVVLWLNLGNCKTDDDIIAQQTKLLRKASSMYNTQNSYMNSSISMSSIGSNGDISLSNLDWTWRDLRDRLKTQFLEQSLKECLLVLDEVNDVKILEALDIGCKILITTRDTGVVENYESQIVKIENSLQKEESLKIFASCLDVEVSELPRQAKTLHELCKGSPFNIALIGAQLAENKEKLKHDRKHWDYYVKKLEKKEFSIFFKSNANPMKAIEVCINALNDNMLQLFKKLAILPHNVKVSTKVLSKLWNTDISKVNPIVKELKGKSLIIETYDREQKNYLYEVHDIIMDYLRTCLNNDEKHKTHDLFLSSYSYTRNNAPVEILDDGYIAFYVGYHILNTNNLNDKWSLFKKLYLDLKFLGNKVRLTGSADVILDLQKYENKIATNDLDKSLIANIKSYLSTHGTDLYHYQCTDIVQSILQHESQGILFTRASEVAQINCEKNELYFDFLHASEQDSEGRKHSTIDVNEDITCISFLGNDLLVGTSDGAVKFFDIPTNKLKKQLFENETSGGAAVKWIGVAYSKNPPIVAVLFSGGVLKLWYIDDIDQDNDDDIIEEEPEEIYNNNVPITIKSRMSTIIKCQWTNNEDYLIAQTLDMIILYLPTGEVVNVIDNFERNVRLLCSVPCSNDRFVAVATTGSRKGVEIIDLKTKEKYISFEDPTPETESVLDILAVPGCNKIITLKSREVTQHDFKINPASIKNCHIFKTRPIITSFDIKENLIFLSIAVNKTGTLLFISTDDSRVICFDLKTNSYLFDLDNRRGNVVTMAVSEILMWDEFVPGSDVLLTGTGTIEKSAKVWYLDAPYISQSTHKNGKVRLTTNFDVSFLHSATPTSSSPTNSGTESANQTPKRHQSFANHKEVKKVLKSTLSLDRRGLKPLNLKGICNNSEVATQPLLAVIDDKNNIQVMRGTMLLTEIIEKPDDHITTVKITPCNQHVIYGLLSGNVKKYTLRTKETTTIMDMYSQIQYMSFVNSNLLMVSGVNRCIMAYRLMDDGNWKTEMLHRGNIYLGSQEILNDIQGVRKPSQSEGLSHSSSDLSLESKDRQFRNSETKELCKEGLLVECFYLPESSLITVENNAAVKLWDKDLKLSCILNARQMDFKVRCAAFKKNVLVICGGRNMMFQTFQLKEGSQTELNLIKEVQINNEITSCDLTADGNILAMGLRSGNVVIWNVKAQRQIIQLRHHKSKVQSCAFSPVPSRLYRSSGQFGTPVVPAEDQPPLVLVTMAAEIVWWDISYFIRMNGNKSGRPNLNAMTPHASPHIETRLDLSADENNANTSGSTNFFFAEGLLNQHCWKAIWKSKTYKQGSKRKEILSCIKLTGMNSKRLCHDEKFSCFVTVDNPGHIHIMNVVKTQCT